MVKPGCSRQKQYLGILKTSCTEKREIPFKVSPAKLIRYDPFWKMLKEKQISQYMLTEHYEISSSTLSKMKHNKFSKQNCSGNKKASLNTAGVGAGAAMGMTIPTVLDAVAIPAAGRLPVCQVFRHVHPQFYGFQNQRFCMNPEKTVHY